MGSCPGSLQVTNSQTHHSKQFTLNVGGQRQKVSVSGVAPSSLSVTFGALQSSILGPLLFIVFMVDVPLHPSSVRFGRFGSIRKIAFFLSWNNFKSFLFLSHLASSENSKESPFYRYFILHISNNPDTVTHKKPINILGKHPPPILLLTYFFCQIYFVPYLER